MINASSLPSDLRHAFRQQVKRAGSRDAAVRQLVEVGLRALIAAAPLLASGAITTPTPARGVVVLRQLLAAHRISIESTRPGRPLTITIQATAQPRLVGEANDGVLVGTNPVMAAVYVAAKRITGSAMFFVGAFRSDDRAKTRTHPALIFLVLVDADEPRAWVVTREELRAVRRRLVAGGSVTCFTKTKSGVRVALPRRSSGLDLDYRVMNASPGTS